MNSAKIPAAILLMSIIGQPTSGARMKGDIPVDPAKMKAGESACVFPIHFTVEGSIWISREAVYRRDDKESCILAITKLKDGWVVHHGTIPIRAGSSHDAELLRLGWINLGRAREVLR